MGTTTKYGWTYPESTSDVQLWNHFSTLAVAQDTTVAAGLLNALNNLKIFASIGGCTLNSSSTTYVDVTGASQAYTKILGSSSSDVVCLLAASSFRASVGSQTTFGINDGTSDHDITKMNFNVGSTHLYAMGIGTITGLAAGSYTFKLRAKGSGANNMTIDSSDGVFMLFAEILKNSGV